MHYKDSTCNISMESYGLDSKVWIDRTSEDIQLDMSGKERWKSRMLWKWFAEIRSLRNGSHFGENRPRLSVLEYLWDTLNCTSRKI